MFEKCIQICEKSSIKELPVMFFDIQNTLKEIFEGMQVQRIEEIYEFWKNKRNLLKRPLLRLLWKPSIDDTNPKVAFRPREKDKMKLRRTNRINE